jgi:hypothetical protein
MPRPGERKAVPVIKLIAATEMEARIALVRALRKKAGKPFIVQEAVQVQSLRQIKRGRNKGKYEIAGRGVFRVPYTYKG